MTFEQTLYSYFYKRNPTANMAKLQYFISVL